MDDEVDAMILRINAYNAMPAGQAKNDVGFILEIDLLELNQRLRINDEYADLIARLVAARGAPLPETPEGSQEGGRRTKKSKSKSKKSSKKAKSKKSKSKKSSKKSKKAKKASKKSRN